MANSAGKKPFAQDQIKVTSSGPPNFWCLPDNLCTSLSCCCPTEPLQGSSIATLITKAGQGELLYSRMLMDNKLFLSPPNLNLQSGSFQSLGGNYFTIFTIHKEIFQSKDSLHHGIQQLSSLGQSCQDIPLEGKKWGKEHCLK